MNYLSATKSLLNIVFCFLEFEKGVNLKVYVNFSDFRDLKNTCCTYLRVEHASINICLSCNDIFLMQICSLYSQFPQKSF